MRPRTYACVCQAQTVFADSLVALADGYGWYAQPPIVDIRNAIAGDFRSHDETGAEASIATGWNGAWEFPMGTVTSVASVERLDAQNERFERHLTLIATAMRQPEFHEEECRLRPSRSLADVFQRLALGADQRVVHLFSAWEPSDELTLRLEKHGTELRHHALSDIPSHARERNRFYRLWTGTPLQSAEFIKAVWQT